MLYREVALPICSSALTDWSDDLVSWLPTPCCAHLFLFMQHHISSGALEAGSNLLVHHLPPIMHSSPHLASACMRAWLSLVVAAAAAGLQDQKQQAVQHMRQAASGVMSQVDWAWVSCPDYDSAMTVPYSAKIHPTLCLQYQPLRDCTECEVLH